MQFGLIGKTLAHSYSAEIHESIGDYRYELLELAENQLADFLKRRDFSGINVTIPYKEAVIPFLDEISESAKAIGAVNTIVNKNGRLSGYNTDFAGLKSLLDFNNISVTGKKVAITGTGGTSKTAYAVAKSLGAGEILFVSRTKRENTVTYSDLYENHKDTGVIINTTPVGMFPDTEGTPVSIDRLPKLSAVVDVIYNPLRTNLLLDAKERCIPCSGGLYMLAAQAVYASALFTGTEADGEKIEKAFYGVARKKENIVLVGMPSSGKSTVGRLIAKKINRGFFDSDTEITAKTKLSPREMIERYGEAAFRKTETEVIAELSKKSGAVIATGGGAVLCRDNVKALRRNGVIVFLNPPVKNLRPTPDRPLSSDYASLERLYSERLPIYKEAADIETVPCRTPHDTAAKIIKELAL